MIDPVILGDCTLYLGDCLEVLPTLEAGSVDAVITDPPYGIGFDRATWSDKPEDYKDFMLKIVSESNRICPRGIRAFWQALPCAPRWHEWFTDDYRIFAACKSFVQYRPTAIQWSWDPIIYWGDINKEPSVYSKDFHVQNKAPFGANRTRIDHPTPRPLEQTIYVVSLFSKAGNTILDPFMGSCTTGVACVQTGRKFIGIEINEDYFNISVKRIQQAQLQMRMEI